MNLSPDTARLAVAIDDDKALHRVVDNLAGLASHTRSPVVHAFADWVAGWQSEDHGSVERAATTMAACRRGAEAARAHHDAAVLAARAGHSGDARRLATIAFGGYERLRAEQLHAPAASGAALGRRVDAPAPGATAPDVGLGGADPDGTTDRRPRGDGLMNSEIAERLFVSRRTVESHLSRVYPKLGFPRRAELAIAARQRREQPVAPFA